MTPPTATLRRARRDAGFTLIEMMLALVLLGLVMGTLIAVLSRQQRFYRSANDVLEARTQVRQATDMLPMDLRGLSSSDARNGTDLYTASDKAIDFRAITGSSVVCKKSSATTLILPPKSVAKGTALTVWLSVPTAGDSMLVYDDSSAAGNADDHWDVYRITDVATIAPAASAWCHTAGGLTQAADSVGGLVSYQISVSNSTPISSAVLQGAPIRFFHRRRYELYQPSGSSNWYLGSFDCNAASAANCPALSPVSGPFAAYSSDASLSGLSFAYYDAAGSALATPLSATDKARVARIRLTARADTRSPIDMPGRARATLRDSLSLDVSLRNAK